MAENKEYYTQKVENGSIQISEDVVASVAAMAVMEQEGVCGLSTGIGSDIAEMLGMKSAAKGVRIVSDKEVWVTANYRESQMSGIEVGKKVEFTTDAVPGVKFKGEVESVSAAASYGLFNNATPRHWRTK